MIQDAATERRRPRFISRRTTSLPRAGVAVRRQHSLRSPRAFACAVLALSFAGASGAAEPIVAFDAPLPLQLGGGFVNAVAGAELANGSLLVAYSTQAGGSTEIFANVLDAGGRPIRAPVSLASGIAGDPSFTVTSDGGSLGGVVWLDTAGARFASFSPDGFSANVTLDVGGLRAAECVATTQNATHFVVCDFIDETLASAPKAPWLFRFGASGALQGTPSPLPFFPVASATTMALAPSAGGGFWLLAEGLDATGEAHEVHLALLDDSGALVRPVAEIGAFRSTSIVGTLGKIDGPGERIAIAVGFAEEGTGNAIVNIQVLSALNNTPLASTNLSSVRGTPLAIAATRQTLGNASVLVVLWLEERAGDVGAGPSSGVAPMFAVLDGGLSTLQAPTGSERLFQFGSTIERGGSAFLHPGAPPSKQGIVAAAPLAPPPPARAPLAPGETNAPLVLALVAIAAGSLGTLAAFRDRAQWFALMLVGPMYTLLRRERVMLDSMRRGAIVQIIHDTPGIGFRDLSRRTEIAPGALQHHVLILRRHGFVHETHTGRSVKFYLAGKNPIAEDPFVEIRARVLDEVRRAPGIGHSELARRLGIRWTTLAYHTQILHAEKQIRFRKVRSRVRYWPRDQA